MEQTEFALSKGSFNNNIALPKMEKKNMMNLAFILPLEIFVLQLQLF